MPVCPNDANFTYETSTTDDRLPRTRVEGGRAEPVEGGGFPRWRETSPHQIATCPDACNDCGNWTFSPRGRRPYLEKPRLFASRASFLADAPRPGFFPRREADGWIAISGRWGGRDVELAVAPDGWAVFRDGVAELRFGSAEAEAPEAARVLSPPAVEGHVVPVGHYHSLRALASGLFSPGAVSWVTAAHPDTSALENSK